jgi:hypothetical protein
VGTSHGSAEVSVTASPMGPSLRVRTAIIYKITLFLSRAVGITRVAGAAPDMPLAEM